MGIEDIRTAVKNGRVEWKKHALSQMLERSISRSDVKSVILRGEVIEEYPDDSPYPSLLVFHQIKDRPIHAVVAHSNENKMAYIITAYEPSLNVFEDDFKTRRMED